MSEPRPQPASNRWQPLRAGLVDLFYYDDEVFHFHDGRLLLRGNNGTGKSKVMALTLPFLLDGRLTPSRVEPDGDSSKRMEWNLLLGDSGERQGYTWLELGRLGDDGPEYCTLGCGLKAVAGRSVRSWFFITPQRVGEDLALVEDGRTPGPERLKQALATTAGFHEQARDYRRAVDERLFGLGPERYEALLDLLLQLRQPQLSKRPDESRLSGALTEALPPLEPGVLADVADAYRNLDAEREETEALEQAQQAVTRFLEHYRQYAAIAARRRAAAVRNAHSTYEDTRATLHHNETALAEAHAEAQRLETREAGIEEAVAEAEEQRATLRDSPAMRSAEALAEAEKTARDRRQYAGQLEARHERTRREHASREQRVTDQSERSQTAETELHTLLDTLREHAGAAGLDGAHTAAVADHGLPNAAAEPTAARDTLLTLHQGRLERVALLDERNATLAEADREAERAREHWQRHSDELERLQQTQVEARAALERAGDALVQRWRDHAASLTELPLPDTEGCLAELADWTSHLEGDNPAAVALAGVRDQHGQVLARERARAEQAREDIQAALDALAAEHERLSSGETPHPPVPHTRDPDARATRAGAPLWQLLEFRDGVPDAERAGLEAALEAAGLLDAWVQPDGAVLGRDAHDTVLTLDAPAAGHPLSHALTPATAWPDDRPPVPAAVIEGVLARIGQGAESACATWVAADGQWRQGPARGAWHKPSAAFIGHAAREAARQARLAAIAEERAEQEAALARTDATLTTLAERDDRARQEWQDRPAERELRQAHADDAAALHAVNAQHERTDNARVALDERRQHAADARQARDGLAADLQLPADPDGLNRVRRALEAYAAGARELRTTLTARNREAELLAQWREELGAAERELEQARTGAEAAEADARAAETRHRTLQASVGAEVASLQAQLREVEARLSRLATKRREVNDQRADQRQRIGKLDSDIEHGRQSLEALGTQRAAAIERLSALAAEGLLEIATAGELSAGESPSWAPEPAVQLARRIEHALANVDDGDSAWQRRQKGLHEHFNELQGSLGRHGHSATIEQQDDLLIVRIVFQNRRRSPDALAGDLAAEVRQRRELLTARERELVENYLIDEVASHLQQRLMETERQVREMNVELADRPTSTGMRLRIRWRPLAEGETLAGLTAPAGLAATRERLLRQSMDAWTPADREAVGAFIQERIEEARRSDDGGDMRQVLERALDYRYWHRFTVERWQNGQWRPAYGPASGGERALVITLPLFAAAASHYGSAMPGAPRLIMLDEVFAGVDDDARAKCMGLLAQFDLDVMMTSEREWGCYPDVPGLAIAQLVRREGIDAVYVIRWRWDGAHRRRESAPQRPAETADEAPASPVNESLF